MGDEGIIGTKLGMTQLFDQESGMVTAVTVIEAGPCPVVQVQTPRPTATRPCSWPSARSRSASCTKPEVGHLKQAGVGAAPPPGRVPRRRGLRRRRDGDRRGVRAGRARSRSAAVARARASPARSSATTSPAAPTSHGSHNVRKPGSIGASATPSRVFKGMRMAGHMGDAARHPARPAGGRGRRRAQPAADRRRRSRVESAASSRSGGRLMAALSAPALRRHRQGQARPATCSASSATTPCCTRW